MAGPTLNGLPLLVATIHEPILGRWSARVEVDTDTAITGTATLSFKAGEVELVGHVHRGGLYSGRWMGTLLGGTGGLTSTVEPKAYRHCPLGLALTDLLSLTGETLHADSEDLSGWIVAHWQRMGGDATSVLHRLSDETGYTWRIGRDGTIWIGTDTFAELDPEADKVGQAPELGVTSYAPRGAPLARPGTTIDDVEVHDVVTSLDGGSLRQEVWSASST